MNLYIEIKDNQPINHPAFEDNLLQAFPDGIPQNWERFVRAERPLLNENQKFGTPESIYTKLNGVWTDVYNILQISDEEKIALKQIKIELFKKFWASLPQRDNFSAWVFNEETIKYEPPIPRPTDREVIWSGANNGWVDKPQKPDDGKEYTLDFYTLAWVEVTQ